MSFALLGCLSAFLDQYNCTVSIQFFSHPFGIEADSDRKISKRLKIFLDNLLGIRQTANLEFDFDYDVRLFDSPVKMREALREKNDINNKSRMIAGYCYEWISESNPDGSDYDIVLEDGFRAKRNFQNSLFAIDPDSFEQVGCIHTTQGLEFDFCGIIIGQRYKPRSGFATMAEPDLFCSIGKIQKKGSKNIIGFAKSGKSLVCLFQTEHYLSYRKFEIIFIF